MINKKIKKEAEEELMDALAPNYSDYMYYKSKEWANVDGTGMDDREKFLDYHFPDWYDFDSMEEYDWEDYNAHHNPTYKIKEVN